MTTAAGAGHHASSTGLALLLGLFLCVSAYRAWDGGMAVFLASLVLATIVSSRASDETPAGNDDRE